MLREIDRQIDRQTGGLVDRFTDYRQTIDRQLDRQIGRQTAGQVYRWIGRQVKVNYNNRQRERQIDRQKLFLILHQRRGTMLRQIDRERCSQVYILVYRLKGKKTDRQTDRQTGRGVVRYTYQYIDRQVDRQVDSRQTDIARQNLFIMLKDY